MARTLWFNTNWDNFEELARQIQDKTGYRARVTSSGAIYFVVNDESAKAIDDALPRYTAYQGEEGSTLPDDTTGFYDDPAAVAAAQSGGPVVDDEVAAGDITAGDDITGDPKGIMQGGKAVRIVKADGKDLWGVVYTVDGIQHIYTFADRNAMIDAMGPDWATGSIVLREDEVNDGDTWIIGSGESMLGQGDQSYASYWEDIKNEAALEAGVRDPGAIGRMMSDPDIARIVAESSAGGWSEVRTLAEIRQTDYYQNVMYPGIKAFFDSGSADPEGQYRRYQQDVDGALALLGYERDEDGTYKSIIGDMLSKGIRAESFTTFATTFKRAEESQDFAESLSFWTQRDLGVDLTFENWLDVVDGETLDSEMAEVVERATLQYVSQQQGVDVGATLLERISNESDLSEGAARQAFEQVQQSLLALGDVGLERYGLTRDELIEAGTGINPSSGRSISEVKRLASKTATELGLADDEKIKLYVGYDQRGRPVTGGLQALSQEGG